MNYSKQGVVVDILHLHKKGLSYRSIARMTGTDRRTIKRYVERPELFREPRTLPARQSKLDSFKERIDTWLQEDPQLRATWIYDHLEGYDGGMTILREYVSRAKAEKRRVAYLRFETEPGLQAQVDFGEFLLEMPGGRIVKFLSLIHISIIFEFRRIISTPHSINLNLVSLIIPSINFHN